MLFDVTLHLLHILLYQFIKFLVVLQRQSPRKVFKLVVVNWAFFVQYLVNFCASLLVVTQSHQRFWMVLLNWGLLLLHLGVGETSRAFQKIPFLSSLVRGRRSRARGSLLADSLAFPMLLVFRHRVILIAVSFVLPMVRPSLAELCVSLWHIFPCVFDWILKFSFLKPAKSWARLNFLSRCLFHILAILARWVIPGASWRTTTSIMFRLPRPYVWTWIVFLVPVVRFNWVSSQIGLVFSMAFVVIEVWSGPFSHILITIPELVATRIVSGWAIKSRLKLASLDLLSKNPFSSRGHDIRPVKPFVFVNIFISIVVFEFWLVLELLAWASRWLELPPLVSSPATASCELLSLWATSSWKPLLIITHFKIYYN